MESRAKHGTEIVKKEGRRTVHRSRMKGRTARLTKLAAVIGGIALVAAASLSFGGAFLDANVYDGLSIPSAAVYAVEMVEIGIGVTVASVIVVMFFTIARAEL